LNAGAWGRPRRRQIIPFITRDPVMMTAFGVIS
jgi:hypothetical protein